MSSRGPPKKKRFRSDGTSIWSSRVISGPGVWVMCVKGKEKQTIGELYDLFELLAEELWPQNAELKDDDTDDGEEDIEKAIAKEVQIIKRPRKEQRFANCTTDTPCVIFISCKPPVDPVQLVDLHMKNVERTGVTHTRNVLRLVPVLKSCDANLPEIVNLSKRVVVPAFESTDGKPLRYKIEIRLRNHSVLSRDEVIKAIAESVPDGHKVDLSDPELFIIVELFKSVCGMSVVRNYHRFKKCNVVELSQASQSLEKGDTEQEER